MRTARRVFLPFLILVYLTSLNSFKVKQPNGSPGGGAGRGEASYTIIPFMPRGSDSIESNVSDLNETGQAVGWIRASDDTTRGLHLDISRGAYTLLSGGEDSSASGVNNFNQIVGSSRGLGAFWPDPAAEPVILPPRPGHVRSRASHINDAGMVVGRSEDLPDQSVPVIWRVTLDDDGIPHVAGPWLLQPWENETYWSTSGINEAIDGTARVVGWSNSGMERAVIWTVSLNDENGTLTTAPPVSLGTLGLIRYSWSRVTGINDSGDVCGISDGHPFCATGDDPLQLLPAPLDMHCGQPQSINELREIVGWVDIYGENQSIVIDLRAYLWRNREAIELNKKIDANSGWHNLQSANCINNAGIIGGWGTSDVQKRGFLLIPNK